MDAKQAAGPRLSRKALRERAVTGHEVELRDGETIVSSTTVGGVLTYVNAYFCEISGYHEGELIGQPHNILRHPDMPVEAFADLWDKLKAGQPWVGMVKNRCKNGDHYWVQAHVAPLRDADGKLDGYLSVRQKVGREQIAGAERDYAAMRAGTLKNVAIRNGDVVRVPLLARLNPLPRLSLGARLYLLAAVGPLLAAVLLTSARAADPFLLLVPALALALLLAWLFARDLARRSDQARRNLEQIAADVFTAPVDISGDDELGRILQGIKTVQTRLGFQLEQMRREDNRARRIFQALDLAAVNIMIANADRSVVFANRALLTAFGDAREQIRQALAGFDPERILGSRLEDFHPEPAQWRELLGGLGDSHRQRVELGALTFDVLLTPVLDERGRASGYITEWKDRTAELRIEREIEQIVAGAVRGELDGRISERDKQGFALNLAHSLNAMLERIGQAMEQIQWVLQALARGDLSRRADAGLQGAFGQMGGNANHTVEQLTDMVGNIQQAVSIIDSAAAEIAEGNDDLARRTEQQAASLQETAAATQELASTVKDNASRAHDARTLASNAAAIAEHGGGLARAAVGTMGRISTASRRIEEIIGVIDGIAFQTNILALNAAVEAARAGEQGKGFAVVASEVRALAQRSASSAQEIKTLIHASVQAVEEGEGEVQQAGQAIGELVAEVGKVATLVAQISGATDEQAQRLGQINQAMVQLDGTTQQNAALVEEASAAARSMAEQAQGLSGQMAHFRLR